LLEKGKFSVEDEIDYSLLKREEEIDIIRLLYDFPNIIINSSEKNEPSFITRYITEIAKNFNRFYHNCPILNEEEDLRKARLLLVYATKLVLNTGLFFLGIEAPDKM